MDSNELKPKIELDETIKAAVQHSTSSSSQRVKKYRENLFGDEKKIFLQNDAERKKMERAAGSPESRKKRLDKDAERKTLARAAESPESRKKRLDKDSLYQRLRLLEIKESPGALYLMAFGPTHRYEQIRNRHEWKLFLECGYFMDTGDRLMDMRFETYEKLWMHVKNNENLLDAFLHLKKGLIVDGLDKDEAIKSKYWDIKKFDGWAKTFMENMKQKKKYFPTSFADLVGIQGFFEINIQIKVVGFGQISKHEGCMEFLVRYKEFLVTDGKFRVKLIMPPSANFEIGQEILIKKCELFWNEEGCPNFHVYALLYIENEVPKKIGDVNIDELSFPDVGNDEME